MGAGLAGIRLECSLCLPAGILRQDAWLWLSFRIRTRQFHLVTTHRFGNGDKKLSIIRYSIEFSVRTAAGVNETGVGRDYKDCFIVVVRVPLIILSCLIRRDKTRGNKSRGKFMVLFVLDVTASTVTYLCV